MCFLIIKSIETHIHAVNVSVQRVFLFFLEEKQLIVRYSDIGGAHSWLLLQLIEDTHSLKAPQCTDSHFSTSVKAGETPTTP